MAFANRPSSLARPGLIITEYRFPIHSIHTSSSSSIESSSTLWKRASGNSSKSLIAIQRSDRKLWLFRTVTQDRRNQTSSSASINSSSTPCKRASVNSSKSFIAIPLSERKLRPFRTAIKPVTTRPHHYRVSITHLLDGKGHPETPVKV